MIVFVHFLDPRALRLTHALHHCITTSLNHWHDTDGSTLCCLHQILTLPSKCCSSNIFLIFSCPFLKIAALVSHLTPQQWERLFSSNTVWISAGPLVSDQLITYLHQQAVEQVYLMKWPVCVNALIYFLQAYVTGQKDFQCVYMNATCLWKCAGVSLSVIVFLCVNKNT